MRRDSRQDLAAEAALSDPGGARHGDHDRRAFVDAALVGGENLRQLGFASEEWSAPRPFTALALVGRADDG